MRILKIKYLIAVFIGVALSLSCGTLFKSEDSQKDKSYGYKYDGEDCTTGNKSFKSKNKYCRTLLEKEANNSCALELRLSAYEADCGPVKKFNWEEDEEGRDPDGEGVIGGTTTPYRSPKIDRAEVSAVGTIELQNTAMEDRDDLYILVLSGTFAIFEASDDRLENDGFSFEQASAVSAVDLPESCNKPQIEGYLRNRSKSLLSLIFTGDKKCRDAIADKDQIQLNLKGVRTSGGLQIKDLDITMKSGES